MQEQKQIELRLSADGSFYYRGDLDHPAIVDLACIAQRTARNYQEAQYKPAHDPLACAVFFSGIAAAIWLGFCILSRPVPNPQQYYQPIHNQELPQ